MTNVTKTITATFSDRTETRRDSRNFTHAAMIQFPTCDGKTATHIAFASSADLAEKSVRKYYNWATETTKFNPRSASGRGHSRAIRRERPIIRLEVVEVNS